MWSAQEDKQAIGRILRYGQQCDVFIYRLIAHGTADVILNNISFDKGVMHEAFIMSNYKLRAYLPYPVLTPCSSFHRGRPQARVGSACR